MNELLKLVSQIPGAILQLPGILLQLAVIAAAITTIFTCLRIVSASIQTVVNLVNTLTSKRIRKENKIITPSLRDIRDYGKPLSLKKELTIYEKQEENRFEITQYKRKIANDNIHKNRDRIDVIYTAFIFIFFYYLHKTYIRLQIGLR